MHGMNERTVLLLSVMFLVSAAEAAVCLFLLAPGVPALVNVSINQSNSAIVQWWRPQNFTKQVDAYFVRYAVRSENFLEEITVDQTDSTQDFFEVHFVF